MFRPIYSSEGPTNSRGTRHATARRVPVNQKKFYKKHSNAPHPLMMKNQGNVLRAAVYRLLPAREANSNKNNKPFNKVKPFPPKGKPLPSPHLFREPSINSLNFNNSILPVEFQLSDHPSNNNTVLTPNENNIHTLFQPIQSPTTRPPFHRQSSVNTAPQALPPVSFRSLSTHPINNIGVVLNQSYPRGGKRKTIRRSIRNKKTHKRK